MPEKESRPASVDLDSRGLLHHLLKERFPDQTAVTASLRASSIVVLKMISDIDRATPIIFCRRPPFFEESTEYQETIVKSLGLQNVSLNDGHEADVKPGDRDHCEHMWVQYHVPGRSLQMLHLNDCLAPFTCWISAVYHHPRPSHLRTTIEVEGRLTRIDPLAYWSKDDVRDFMKAHKLPYHKMAKRTYNHKEIKQSVENATHHY